MRGSRFAACCWAIIALCTATPRVSAQKPTDTLPNISWRDIALGGGAAVLTMMADAPIAHAIHGHESAGTLRTAERFNHFGEPVVYVPVVGALLVGGWLAHDPKLTRVGRNTVGALVVAGAVTQTLKFMTGRTRPDSDPDLSGNDFHPFQHGDAFPSGHTAVAFALATALGDGIDKTWARAGLYTLATGTAWARLATEHHWASDVVAGAMIGIASAKFAEGRWTVLGLHAPAIIVGRDRVGASWTVPTPRLLTR